jgi:hypothetical protein
MSVIFPGAVFLCSLNTYIYIYLYIYVILLMCHDLQRSLLTLCGFLHYLLRSFHMICTTCILSLFFLNSEKESPQGQLFYYFKTDAHISMVLVLRNEGGTLLWN